MRSGARVPATGGRAAHGFTLMELMMVILVIGLVTALIVPNLGAYVPKARLDAAASKLVSNIDYARSEARIQAKRVSIELDLQHSRWRYVYPPEQRLTTDQDLDTLEEREEGWHEIEEDVVFAGAGNASEPLARNGLFRLVFDEDGNTGDQCVLLKLRSDPTMIWTVQIHGLTGQCEVIPNFEGKEHLPVEVGEGAF